MYSVLPPPPKYPSVTSAGQPILETNNILEHYTGPEHQLVVGEGTYILRDELYLATPPPHPSEAPIVNPNPLATNLQPPTAGTKLSLAILAPKHTLPQKPIRPDTPISETSGTASSRCASNHENESSRDSKAGSVAPRNTQLGQGDQSKVSVFGQNNPTLANVNGKDTKGGRRKPKNNIIKSNSSYVSRVIPHETLTKRLQDHSPDGLFAFANINRAVQWLDLSSPTKAENLTKILFTKAHALCHDVNPITKSSSHLDFVMGSSTGDFIWYEPMSQKYARLNKNGIINDSPVSDVKWIPNSENLFLAAHFDGSLIVYDKEKEDAAFISEETNEVHQTNGAPNEKHIPKLQIKKSVQSRNQKTNPVSYWEVSSSKINAFAFSPDGKHLAVASEDGGLRIINCLREELVDVFISYYGGLLTVTWSPDGHYILTGGQDDLVSIWSLADSMLVARCQGHNSWVTDVKFDPWRCDERTYRFGSVGEDCRLLLWDFSVGMLHRPRASSVRRRLSISSGIAQSKNCEDSETTRLRSDSNLSNGSLQYDDIVHPVQPRNRTATLPPVMAKQVDEHPLCWLNFEEDCIMTSCKEGHIRTWDRPREGAGDVEAAPSSTGSKNNKE